MSRKPTHDKNKSTTSIEETNFKRDFSKLSVSSQSSIITYELQSTIQICVFRVCFAVLAVEV